MNLNNIFVSVHFILPFPPPADCQGLFSQVVVSNTRSCDLKTGVLGVNFPIVDLSLETSNTNFTENTTFAQTATNGSHVTCVRYYDDGFMQTTYDSDWPLSVDFEHNYTDTGLYNFELRCYNFKDWVSITKEISVQVPITDFEILSQFNFTFTGEDLSINWTMAGGTNVTFTASTTTSLSLGDVSYTHGDTMGILPIPWTYEIGGYEVKISAENNVSSAERNTVVKIQEAITGLDISAHLLATTINTDIDFTGNISTGTEVVWDWDWGDGTSGVQDVTTAESGEQINTQTHQYSSIGYYMVTLTASNLISSMSVTLPIIIEIGLSGLSLDTSNVTRSSDTVTFSVSTSESDDPTDVVYDVWFGDGTIHNGQPAPLTQSSPGDFTYNFGDYGYYDVEILFRNNISMVVMTVRIRVGVYIEGFTFDWTPAGDTNDPNRCAMFDTDHSFSLHIDQGSDVHFNISWGDATSENDIPPSQSTNWNNAQDITKMKQWSPGTYTITALVWNNFSDDSITLEVIIERPLPETSIDDITFTPLVGGAATIYLKHRLATGPVVQDVRCNVTWGDGNSDTNILWTEDGTENLVFKVQHDYSGQLAGTFARKYV